jgi:proton glutamate symport protein
VNTGPTRSATARSGATYPSLTTQILIGLVAGAVLGAVWPGAGIAVKPLADAFLRMIKMIIAPLLFSTLVAGIAGAGDLKALGRIGFKAIVYFEVATTVALAIGLGLANIFQPGAGIAMPAGDTSTVAAIAKNSQSAWDIFLHLFPTSVVDAMARGDILQLVVFSIFFGIGVAAIGGQDLRANVVDVHRASE